MGVENEFTPTFDFSNVEPQFNNEILGENLEPSVGSSRKNKDSIYNPCGRSCVEFCRELGLLILNGRCRGDYEGEFTFTSHKGASSTIDLMLSTPSIIPEIKEIKVLSRNDLSDHAPVHIFLSTMVARDGEVVKTTRPCQWVQESWPDYADAVERVIPKIRGIVEEGCSGGRRELATASSRLSKALLECCREVKSTVKPPSDKDGWWDRTCAKARDAHLVAFFLHKEGYISKGKVRKLKNKYRSLVKSRIRYVGVMMDRKYLQDLLHHARDFWKIYKGQKKQCTIQEVEVFVFHFQRLYGAANAADLPQSSPCGAPGDEGGVYPELGGIKGPQSSHPVHSESILKSDLITLNEEFSIEEISGAIKELGNGKSTSDMLFPELFKYAKGKDEEGKFTEEVILAPGLCAMFNKAFAEGAGIPDSWLKAYLVPIFKGKGSEGDVDNYRGVAICSTLYRIYAAALSKRLDVFSEKHGLRAVTQCGFRKRCGTISAIFALMHAINNTCSSVVQGGKNKPMVSCFVDFRKAFDSVPRALVWKRLRELGIHGNFLNAIMDLYRKTSFQVKVNGKVSEGFVVTVSGVRQGCPLSPILFGLFIEQFQAKLKSECPNIGVFIFNGDHLKDITFADDIILMTYNREDMSILLACLQRFCAEYHMSVNVPKTKGVIYHRKGMRVEELLTDMSFDSQNIDIQSSFIYLGINVHQCMWLRKSAEHTSKAAKRALWAMIRRFQEMKILCLDTKIRLFNTLVLPIANYACQTWGVYYLLPVESSIFTNNPVQKLILYFLRLISGCREKVSRWILMREFGLLPVQVQWAKLCARVWNKTSRDIKTLQEESLDSITMRADLELFKKGNTKCWTALFLEAMVHLGRVGEYTLKELRAWEISRLLGVYFTEEGIEEAYVKCYKEMHPALQFGQDIQRDLRPYVVGDKDRSIDKYFRWFHDPSFKMLKTPIPEIYFRTGILFRTGGINFKDNDFRYKRGGSRADKGRQCDNCSLNVVEDEYHVVFDCTFYNSLREDKRFSMIFKRQERKNMIAFTTQKKQCEVWDFIFHLVRSRFKPVNPLSLSSTSLD